MGFFSTSKQYQTSGLDGTGQSQQTNLFNQLGNNPYASVQFAGAQPTLQLNSLGLTNGQQLGFDQAVKTAAGQFSGNFAANGMLQPQHIGSIAGSAAQYVMPQFAQLMSQNYGNLFNQNMQNAQNDLGAQQFNVNTNANRFSQLLQALGQRQVSNGASTGPGLGYSLFAGAGGQAAGGIGQGVGKGLAAMMGA